MGGQIMTKEEKQKQNQTMKIAKFCRFNIASKKTKLRKEEYDYFTAHDAIETLYNSKHRVKDGENVPRAERKAGALYTRDDCTLFFKHLVHNRMAARCMKKYKDDEPEDAKKGKKRKYKIVGHPHQAFFDDSEEVYIWLWNPTPFMHWVYGCGVLLVVIGGTLFPLWPSSLRTGVYYSSVSVAGFIGSILVIGLLRTILFGIIWGLTGGRHNFWFLPNLLADVGFWESFVPVYTYDVYDNEGNKIRGTRGKKKIAAASAEGEEQKKDQ